MNTEDLGRLALRVWSMEHANAPIREGETSERALEAIRLKLKDLDPRGVLGLPPKPPSSVPPSSDLASAPDLDPDPDLGAT